MSQTNSCPECGKTLYERTKRCSCGWTKPAIKTIQEVDFRCQYQSWGKRCPLPGTTCPYPYAKDPWYCADHSRALSDPQKGEAILKENEKNFHKILADRQDWRRKLFPFLQKS